MCTGKCLCYLLSVRYCKWKGVTRRPLEGSRRVLEFFDSIPVDDALIVQDTCVNDMVRDAWQSLMRTLPKAPIGIVLSEI